MDDRRKEVVGALGEWLLRVADNKTATPEEISALPGVAKEYFDGFSRLSHEHSYAQEVAQKGN